MIKNFNKDRKGKLSEFISMNLDRDISRNELDDFFDDRVEERKVYQDEMIKQRIEMVAKIKDDEWKGIINQSNASVEKKMAKLEKKGVKDPFESVMKTIKSTILDQDNQSQATSLIQNFKQRYTKLIDEVNAVNTVESKLLSNRNSTAEEFQKLAKDMNQLREKAYQSFIDLHFDMKDITNETEWTKVMKAVNKIIS
jgi:hypothetical protein